MSSTTTVHDITSVELVTRQYASFFGSVVVFRTARGETFTVEGFSDQPMDFGSPKVMIYAPRDVAVEVTA